MEIQKEISTVEPISEIPKLQTVKEQRLKRLLEILSKYVNRELSVKEIATYMHLTEKQTRKYLRLLRKELGNDLVFYKRGQILIYIYKPTQETLEKVKKIHEINKKKYQRRIQKMLSKLQQYQNVSNEENEDTEDIEDIEIEETQ
jgi:predicted type IV restriction endonuclease